MWFALRVGPTTFAIFDTFADEAGRQRHLNGPIAQALMAKAPDLFAAPPAIEPLEVLGAKLPAAA
jgi:quinol monooxygenase YgiN